MQKLGQHFLKDTTVLQAIVDELDVQKGEVIVEIGPGHGELTAPLLQVIGKKSGKALIAIEKDHSLIAVLGAIGEQEPKKLLNIIEGDALKVLLDAVAGLHHYKIAGNIPYYITGKLLRVISELDNKPQRTVLLIQKEVAERICVTPPEMNRLAASVQFWANPEIVTLVPRKSFTPPPDVDSAVIALSTKSSTPPVDPALYYRVVRGIFAQPRKTILNNASAMLSGSSQKEDIAGQLKKLGINPAGRPQDLTIEQIIALAKTELWG